MALRLYMDVHVAFAITAGLRRRGLDVLTSQEDGTRENDDESLLARATSLNRVIFTQDEDFLSLAAEWQANSREFCGIIFAHQLGPGIGRIIDDLELLAKASEPDEVRNRVMFLPL